MLFVIPDLISSEQVSVVLDGLSKTEFTDGRPTAGLASRSVKNNLQVTWEDKTAEPARKLILDALDASPMFQFLALPKMVLPPTFNKYENGMDYGDHIDHAILGKPLGLSVRSDISLTLFLTPPGDYDGGELVLTRDGREIPIKLDVGQAVIYSATAIHRVNPVTRGARIAAVTSAQSLVADETRRDMLGEITQVLRWVQDMSPEGDETKVLQKVYANLIRMWAES
ncbi:MAG: Fe2+-dependent dioxygenase [Gammaproteobacteria bacterium]